MTVAFTNKFALPNPSVGTFNWHPYWQDITSIIDLHVPKVFNVPPTVAASLVVDANPLHLAIKYYYYKVVAVNLAGEYTMASFVEAYAVTDAGHRTIQLNWSAVSGAVSYNLYRYDGSASYEPVIADNLFLYFKNVPGATTWNDDGLIVPGGAPFIPTAPNWNFNEIQQISIMPDLTQGQTYHATPINILENLDNVRNHILVAKGTANWNDAVPVTLYGIVNGTNVATQYIRGGNQTGQGLTIDSTAHATKGFLILQPTQDTVLIGGPSGGTPLSTSILNSLHVVKRTVGWTFALKIDTSGGIAPITLGGAGADVMVTSLNANYVGGKAETAFALLAGRVGGQTLNGGSNAGNTLTLKGTTADATSHVLLASPMNLSGFVLYGSSGVSTDMSLYASSNGTNNGTIMFYNNACLRAKTLYGSHLTAGNLVLKANNVDNTGTININSSVVLTPPTAVVGLQINQSQDGGGIEINMSGVQTHAGIYVLGKYPLNAFQNVAGGYGLYVQRNNGASETQNLVTFHEDHPSSTVNVVQITNDGTGMGLHINQNGNYRALQIDSLSASENALQIYSKMGIFISQNAIGGRAIMCYRANGTLETQGVINIYEASGTSNGPALHAETASYNSYAIHAYSSASAAACYVVNIHAAGNSVNSKAMQIKYGTSDNSGVNYAVQWLSGNGTTMGAIFSSGYYTTYGNTSDIRLKTDIKDTKYTLADLMNLRVVDFKMKACLSVQHIGLIAQEVFDVYKPAVMKPDKEEEFWMIDYARFTPLLIKAVQELTARVKTLEGN